MGEGVILPPQRSIGDVPTKFGIPNSPQSPDIGQNSDGIISKLWLSGQSLIKENCNNSRTSFDIDMKFEPVTKINNRNKKLSKKFGGNII